MTKRIGRRSEEEQQHQERDRCHRQHRRCPGRAVAGNQMIPSAGVRQPEAIAGIGRHTAVNDYTNAPVQPSTVQPSSIQHENGRGIVVPAQKRDQRRGELQEAECDECFHEAVPDDEPGTGNKIGSEPGAYKIVSATRFGLKILSV